MKSPCRFGERLAANQPHGIKRRFVPITGDQLVDRHDARMLELPRDARFVEKARDHGGIGGALRLEFLQGHVAAQFRIVRYPDVADTAAGMRAE